MSRKCSAPDSSTILRFDQWSVPITLTPSPLAAIWTPKCTELPFRDMAGCPQPLLGFLTRCLNLTANRAENAGDPTVPAEAFDLETRVYARSRKVDDTDKTADERDGHNSSTLRHL